ncbi:MAG: hypothetical protein Q9227_005515 [Pyrenula ochraceoflavens]
MGIGRTSMFRTAFRSSSRPTLRTGARPVWRQSPRAYATEHGAHSKGSDVPWAIGSATIFFPSAYWLWQQGPEKSSHGHAEHHEEHDEGSGDSNEGDSKDDSGEAEGNKIGEGEGESSGEESKDSEGAESQDNSNPDEGAKDAPSPQRNDSENSTDASDDEGSSKSDSQATSSDEEQSDDKTGKGGKPKSKLDKRRDNGNETTGAYHPAFSDPEKSEKAEGVKDTAKIKGTVDPFRPAQWKKDTEK